MVVDEYVGRCLDVGSTPTGSIKAFHSLAKLRKTLIYQRFFIFTFCLSPLDNEASKILTVKHGNVRQNFDKITMANASQEFSGGSNLDSLKGWFGEPSSTSQEQAGDAKLDVYNWQYDNVVVTAKLFNNSTVVKSISNFSYVRDPKITLKMYENLKNGTSYDDAVKTLGTPDVYSIAVSSDATMTQALWSSNLVAKKGETGSLTLNFKNGALENKSQANLINK